MLWGVSEEQTVAMETRQPWQQRSIGKDSGIHIFMSSLGFTVINFGQIPFIQQYNCMPNHFVV